MCFLVCLHDSFMMDENMKIIRKLQDLFVMKVDGHSAGQRQQMKIKVFFSFSPQRAESSPIRSGD